MYMFQPEQTQALRDPRVDDRSGSPTPMNVTSNSKWVGEPDYIQMTGLPADGAPGKWFSSQKWQKDGQIEIFWPNFERKGLAVQHLVRG